MEFHLQDYNYDVLYLITLPNLILTWYFSNAAKVFRESNEQEDIQEGELSLSQDLIDAFGGTLNRYQISFTFISGPWSRFPSAHAPPFSYDLILTSETIYRPESYEDIIGILKTNLAPTVDHPNDSNAIQTRDVTFDRRPLGSDPGGSQALIASKVLYFGVGGGIDEFSNRITTQGGRLEVVWSSQVGVIRKILQASW